MLIKITSRPWTLSAAVYDVYSNCFICSLTQGQFVFARIAGRTKEECEANGALFFTSKDLYSVLSSNIFLLEGDENDPDDIQTAIDAGRKVLNEAEGNVF